ncbi:hypothetical protein [Pseudomonas panipatensis]|uniref:hypothetical protein n=1 Tax=Pseudomonas panipatensis TaxID=428992 RepID=UPI0024B77960|nr:hypothetical protein [Pseudomonas panipatensis]
MLKIAGLILQDRSQFLEVVVHVGQVLFSKGSVCPTKCFMPLGPAFDRSRNALTCKSERVTQAECEAKCLGAREFKVGKCREGSCKSIERRPLVARNRVERDELRLLRSQMTVACSHQFTSVLAERDEGFEALSFVSSVLSGGQSSLGSVLVRSDADCANQGNDHPDCLEPTGSSWMLLEPADKSLHFITSMRISVSAMLPASRVLWECGA